MTTRGRQIMLAARRRGPELTDFRVGFAAAVTTPVHHAAGVRVRERPIKIEELLA